MEFDSFFEKNYCAEKDCCFSTNTDWVELYWDDKFPYGKPQTDEVARGSGTESMAVRD